MKSLVLPDLLPYDAHTAVFSPDSCASPTEPKSPYSVGIAVRCEPSKCAVVRTLLFLQLNRARDTSPDLPFLSLLGCFFGRCGTALFSRCSVGSRLLPRPRAQNATQGVFGADTAVLCLPRSIVLGVGGLLPLGEAFHPFVPCYRFVCRAVFRTSALGEPTAEKRKYQPFFCGASACARRDRNCRTPTGTTLL